MPTRGACEIYHRIDHHRGAVPMSLFYGMSESFLGHSVAVMVTTKAAASLKQLNRVLWIFADSYLTVSAGGV